jgi:prepilin-type N-terminal cleavage/methylation domain-containing protein
MSIIPPSKKSGFTLIEIVIVLAIGALIMVVVFVAAQGALMARRNEQRRSDARRVLAAVESNPNLVDLSCFGDAIPCTGKSATTEIKRVLGVTTFEDPTQVRNSGNTQVIPASDTNKAYNVVFRPSTASGVVPSIEIRLNGKCKKTGNRWNFETSVGNNAVIIGLEPFNITGNGTVGQWQVYGTSYCINT